MPKTAANDTLHPDKTNLSKPSFAKIGRNAQNFASNPKDREFIIPNEKVRQIKEKQPLRAR